MTIGRSHNPLKVSGQAKGTGSGSFGPVPVPLPSLGAPLCRRCTRSGDFQRNLSAPFFPQSVHHSRINRHRNLFSRNEATEPTEKIDLKRLKKRTLCRL